MSTPANRYHNDPGFNRLVNMLEALIAEAQFTPGELREALILAATHYEIKKKPFWIVESPDLRQFAVDLSIQSTHLLNARKQLDQVIADANAADIENAGLLKEAEERLRTLEAACATPGKPKRKR